MKQRIAVLGLGTMGMGMAKNLLKAGYSVTAYNRTRAKTEALVTEGASVSNTPEAAARDADVIISMLSDDQASRQVWIGDAGALNASKPGTILVESSTVSPAWIGELADLASARNLDLLDAPVTGSKTQSESGQLIFLVGGGSSVLERVRPILDAMSKQVVMLGPVGSGSRMKLINNFLCGVQVASLAEGLAWLERSGLDREKAIQILRNGAPGSPLLGAVSDRMNEATYNVNFSLPLMGKDLHYAQADAATFGVKLSTGRAAEIRFTEAASAGYGGKDMSAVIEPIRADSKRE